MLLWLLLDAVLIVCCVVLCLSAQGLQMEISYSAIFWYNASPLKTESNVFFVHGPCLNKLNNNNTIL